MSGGKEGEKAKKEVIKNKKEREREKRKAEVQKTKQALQRCTSNPLTDTFKKGLLYLYHLPTELTTLNPSKN